MYVLYVEHNKTKQFRSHTKSQCWIHAIMQIYAVFEYMQEWTHTVVSIHRHVDSYSSKNICCDPSPDTLLTEVFFLWESYTEVTQEHFTESGALMWNTDWDFACSSVQTFKTSHWSFQIISRSYEPYTTFMAERAFNCILSMDDLDGGGPSNCVTKKIP